MISPWFFPRRSPSCFKKENLLNKNKQKTSKNKVEYPLIISSRKKINQRRKSSFLKFFNSAAFAIFLFLAYFHLTSWAGIEPVTIVLQSEWPNNCATETECDRVVIGKFKIETKEN